MADRVIDYDRGVLIMTEPLSGSDVFMYVDEPGKYLSAHGTPISEQFAKAAGYDVEKFAKDRVKLDRKRIASAAIDAELSDDKDTKNNVVETVGGYKLVDIGLGRYLIRDPDDNLVTATPLAKEHAMKVISLLAEKDEVSAVPESAPSLAPKEKVVEQKNGK